MTTNAVAPLVEYIEDGVTLTHPLPFRFDAQSHLIVSRIADGEEETLALGSDYSASGAGAADGGELVKVSAGTAGTVLRVRRHTPRLQETDYAANDLFPAESHERALDRQMHIAQEIDASVTDLSVRALLVPPGEEAGALPPAADGVGKALVRTVDGGFAYVTLNDAGGVDTLETLGGAEGGEHVGLSYDLAGLPVASVLHIFRNGPELLLHMFRKEDEADDILAFQRALTFGLPIYLKAGEGADENGDYLIQTLEDIAGRAHYLPAGTTISGDRGRTVIRPLDPGEVVFRTMSASAGTTIDDVTLRDLILYGHVETAGFEEQVVLAAFNGVRRLVVEHVTFKGFQGDGLLLASGEELTSERHNSDVRVENCEFDGINQNNRQCISVLDVDGLTIRSCVFKNSTKVGDPTYMGGAFDVMDKTKGLGMPGALDFEPNPNAFHIMRDIIVEGCTFFNIGGNVGALTLTIPAVVTALPRAFTVRDCKFRSYAGIGADIYLSTHRALTSAANDMAILLEGNTGVSGRSPYNIRAAAGVTLRDNVWDTYTHNATIGDGASDKAWNVTLLNERMRACGSSTAARGLRVGTVERFTIDGLLLDKCGDDDAGGYALQFATGVTSVKVRIRGLTVIPNTGQVRAIDSEDDLHVFTPAGNRYDHASCDLGGLASDFRATAPGQLLKGSKTYDPASVTPAAPVTTTVTVTGAALGDFFLGASLSIDQATIAIEGYISATDTVTVIYTQPDTDATGVDLASATLSATVMKALA